MDKLGKDEDIKKAAKSAKKSLQKVYPEPITGLHAPLDDFEDIDKSDSSGSGNRSKTRRYKKPLVIFLAVVAVIVITVFVVTKTSGILKERSVVKDITQKRSVANKTADQTLSNTIEYLRNENVIDKQIAYSKQDICYMGHNDAGWTVTNWRQNCYVRYVVGFEALVDRETARGVLLGNQSIFGEVNTEFGAEIFECELAVKRVRDSNNIGSFTTIRHFGADNPPSSDNFNCEVQGVYQGTFSVYSSITFDSELSIKTFTDTDLSSIHALSDNILTTDTTFVEDLYYDLGKKYLWIEHDENYYNEDVGCGILLCNNPRPEPIHPEL